MAKHKMI